MLAWKTYGHVPTLPWVLSGSCCQSPQNTLVCRPHVKHFWQCLRPEQGQALLAAVGAHISFQGEVCSTQHFLLSTGITAAQTPWCQLSVHQFMDVFSPSCIPGSSFPLLDSFLSLNFFKRKCHKWILQQLEEHEHSWKSRTGAKEQLTGEHGGLKLMWLCQGTAGTEYIDVYQLFSTIPNHLFLCICEMKYLFPVSYTQRVLYTGYLNAKNTT